MLFMLVFTAMGTFNAIAQSAVDVERRIYLEVVTPGPS